MRLDAMLSESAPIAIGGAMLLLLQAVGRRLPSSVRRLSAILKQKRDELAVWSEVRRTIRSSQKFAARLGISPNDAARQFGRFRDAAEFRKITWEMALLTRRDPSLGLDR